MINFTETQTGDIVKLVAPGAVGYAKLGDLLRVTEVHKNSVHVEDRDGNPCEFIYNCGAERLEVTEWKEDFPTNAN